MDALRKVRWKKYMRVKEEIEEEYLLSLVHFVINCHVDSVLYKDNCPTKRLV